MTSHMSATSSPSRQVSRSRLFPLIAITASAFAAIGISRIMLGVHDLSDVIGAWALGVAWLGLTAYAFEIMRRESGRPVTRPLTEGLEPEAASDLKPAVPDRRAGPPHRARVGAGIIVAWILILGVVVGFGELVTRYGGGNIAGDHTIPHWLAAHRTSTLTAWSAAFSTLGATQMILAITVLTAVVALAVTRRWRPVIFVALVMIGEVGLFVTAEAIVQRPRPDVVHLETQLPTSSYPSGHVAATLCIYTAIAILVLGHTRRWWRWPFLALAVLMPVLVATGRMYRGMHHPTDVLGSIILAGLLLTAMYWAIRPNADVAARPRRIRPATEPPATEAGPASAALTTDGDRLPVHAAHDGSPDTAHHG
jgi:undecaprenyl-diphosphatase